MSRMKNPEGDWGTVDVGYCRKKRFNVKTTTTTVTAPWTDGKDNSDATTYHKIPGSPTPWELSQRYFHMPYKLFNFPCIVSYTLSHTSKKLPNSIPLRHTTPLQYSRIIMPENIPGALCLSSHAYKPLHCGIAVPVKRNMSHNAIA